MLDRIDLQVQVSAIENQQLLDQERKIDGDSNQTIQARVCKARNIQLERQGKINTHLTSQELNQICPLNKELKALLDQAIDRFGLSTRGFYRVLKVPRTLADLAGMEHPKLPQYQEALIYRSTIDKRVGINS